MTIDVNKKQEYLIESGLTSNKVEGTNSAKASTMTVPVGQTEMLQNVDCLSKFTAQVKTQKTKRSEEELYNSVKNILIKNQITHTRQEAIDLLKDTTGYTEKELLNLDSNELNKKINCINTAITKLKKEKAGLNLKEIAKLANDYNVATLTGWSINGFEKQQATHEKQSVTKRLIIAGNFNADTNCEDYNKISPFIKEILKEQNISWDVYKKMNVNKRNNIKAEALDRYLNSLSDAEYTTFMERKLEEFFVDTLCSQINANTSEAERNKIYRRQLQTFGRLLVNTENERDRAALALIIDKLYKSNILPAAQAGLSSMRTDNGKDSFAMNVDVSKCLFDECKYEKIFSKDGLKIGAKMTKEEGDKFQWTIYSNIKLEHVESKFKKDSGFYSMFFAKNKEQLDIIYQKKDANPDVDINMLLTSDELKLLEQSEELKDNYVRFSANAQLGIAQSKQKSVIENRSAALAYIADDIANVAEITGDQELARDVMTTIVQEVENNPDILNMPLDEFITYMDEATNGNFSIVVNDLANNTTTPLNAPAQNTSVEVEANNVPAEPVNNTVVKENIVSNTNAYTNDVNVVDTTFNNQNANQTKELVEKFYKQYNVENETEYVTPALEKKVPKTMAEVKSVDDYKKFEETSGKGSFQNALEAFSKNIAAPVKEYILGKIANWDSSRLVDFANAVKDNDAKKETGKLITSSSDLGKVKCNNSGVQDFFDTLIEQRKEKEA